MAEVDSLAAVRVGQNVEAKETQLEECKKIASSTVLKIGDDNDGSVDKDYYDGIPSGSQKYFYRNRFKDYYLRKLILQDISPSTKKHCYLMDEFGLSTWDIKSENTRYLRFYYRPDVIDTSWRYEVICGPTISGERLMSNVRHCFKDQTWTSDDTFLVPYRSKMTIEAARKVVSKCVDDEYQRLFNFIVFLHKQHVKKE